MTKFRQEGQPKMENNLPVDLTATKPLYLDGGNNVVEGPPPSAATPALQAVLDEGSTATLTSNLNINSSSGNEINLSTNSGGKINIDIDNSDGIEITNTAGTGLKIITGRYTQTFGSSIIQNSFTNGAFGGLRYQDDTISQSGQSSATNSSSISQVAGAVISQIVDLATNKINSFSQNPSVANQSFVVRDDINEYGASAFADYSANWGDLNYTHKKWVEDQIAPNWISASNLSTFTFAATNTSEVIPVSTTNEGMLA